MVAKMFSANDHGAGIAWREKGADGKPVVKWQKGLELPAMQEMIEQLTLPFVAHFRIASSGGKSAALCHPFPIGKDADLSLEGETKGYVLFHNGHWGEWKSFSKETALRMGRPLPLGRWSDSRAMAWATHNYGPGILEMIDEKVVIFGPKDLEVIRGNGWDEVNGVWCSNKSWDWGHNTTYRSYDYRRTPNADPAQQPPFGGRSDPNNKDDYFKTPPASMAGSTVVVPGGNLTQLPFDLVQKMWDQQQSLPRAEWSLSKKQFKRLKNKHEKELKRADQNKGRIIPLQQSVH